MNIDAYKGCKRPAGNRHDHALIRCTPERGWFCFACEVESLTAEIEQLQKALRRCVEELEENIEFEGPLASFKEAARIGRALLLETTKGTDRVADDYDPRNDPDLPEVLRDPQETLKHGREVLKRIESDKDDWRPPGSNPPPPVGKRPSPPPNPPKPECPPNIIFREDQLDVIPLQHEDSDDV